MSQRMNKQISERTNEQIDRMNENEWTNEKMSERKKNKRTNKQMSERANEKWANERNTNQLPKPLIPPWSTTQAAGEGGYDKGTCYSQGFHQSPCRSEVTLICPPIHETLWHGTFKKKRDCSSFPASLRNWLTGNCIYTVISGLQVTTISNLENRRCWAHVVLIIGQRCRRWPNNKTTLAICYLLEYRGIMARSLGIMVRSFEPIVVWNWGAGFESRLGGIFVIQFVFIWLSSWITLQSHCIALHCIALHCIALHCFALHYISTTFPLLCIALHISVLKDSKALFDHHSVLQESGESANVSLNLPWNVPSLLLSEYNTPSTLEHSPTFVQYLAQILWTFPAHLVNNAANWQCRFRLNVIPRNSLRLLRRCHRRWWRHILLYVTS